MDLTRLNSIKEWIPPAGNDQVEGHREDGAESGGEAVQVGVPQACFTNFIIFFSESGGITTLIPNLREQHGLTKRTLLSSRRRLASQLIRLVL